MKTRNNKHILWRRLTVQILKNLKQPLDSSEFNLSLVFEHGSVLSCELTQLVLIAKCLLFYVAFIVGDIYPERSVQVEHALLFGLVMHKKDKYEISA